MMMVGSQYYSFNTKQLAVKEKRLKLPTYTLLFLILVKVIVVESGLADPAPRIIGGAPSEDGAWPTMVSLHVQGNIQHLNGFRCGGNLIGTNWVLTAAHCVDGLGPSSFSVRVGSNSSNSGGTEHSVSNVVVHPQYDPFSKQNDIALLKLVTRTNISHPMAFGTTAIVSETATVMGWGTTVSSGSSAPIRLREVNVPIVSNAVCNNPVSYNGTITSDMLCAGYTQGGKDSCQGDSGGPLIVQRNGLYQQVGVVSWGDGCAEQDLYGIYSRVSSNKRWIQNKIGSTSLNGGSNVIITHGDVTKIEDRTFNYTSTDINYSDRSVYIEISSLNLGQSVVLTIDLRDDLIGPNTQFYKVVQGVAEPELIPRTDWTMISSSEFRLVVTDGGRLDRASDGAIAIELTLGEGERSTGNSSSGGGGGIISPILSFILLLLIVMSLYIRIASRMREYKTSSIKRQITNY